MTPQRGAAKTARHTIAIAPAAPLRKPEWIRIRLSHGDKFGEVKRLLREQKLHTVCEEAACPNISVSLGEYTTVGNMMGGLTGGALFIEGTFARLMYQSLYKMHELALHGFTKVALDTIARLISRRTEPPVKLH